MTTSAREPRIEYGLRTLTDLARSWKYSGNRVMYYLSDGPERAFVSEELMLISEDTELPPDYIEKW